MDEGPAPTKIFEVPKWTKGTPKANYSKQEMQARSVNKLDE